ncbi:hypothetical protein ACOMHN_045083 [Nucella lapillus]
MARGKPGMKKVRTTPTNTSVLPPCKVCLGPAAGFHYGANTCEACKGFFSRSLHRIKPYKCATGSDNCSIQGVKRDLCPKCRHLKCLAAGMSKGAIKTGRYTHAKRTQNILEYQEMMKQSTTRDTSSPSPSGSAPTPILQYSSDSSSKPPSPHFSDCSQTFGGLDSPLVSGGSSSGVFFSTDLMASVTGGHSEVSVPDTPPRILPRVLADAWGTRKFSFGVSPAPSSSVGYASPVSGSLTSQCSSLSLEMSGSLPDVDLPQSAEKFKSPQSVTGSPPSFEKPTLSSLLSWSPSTGSGSVGDSSQLLRKSRSSLPINLLPATNSGSASQPLKNSGPSSFFNLSPPTKPRSASLPLGNSGSSSFFNFSPSTNSGSASQTPGNSGSSSFFNFSPATNSGSASQLLGNSGSSSFFNYSPSTNSGSASQPLGNSGSSSFFNLPPSTNSGSASQPLKLPGFASAFGSPQPVNLGTAHDSSQPLQSLVSAAPSCEGDLSSEVEDFLRTFHPQEHGKGGDLSDQDCSLLVAHLVRAHNDNMMPVNEMCEQSLLKSQTKCFDTCRAKADLYGECWCGIRSKDEYMDFYSKTGIDVDNRQCLMVGHLVPLIEQALVKYVDFCKMIPGFNDLSQNDKLKLIKSNRCEFRMLCSYKYYNQQLKVMTLESGSSVCFHEVAMIVGEKHVCERFKCAQAIRELGLSHPEVVLLQSLIIFTPGAEAVEESDKVSAIQWQLAQCLLWQLRQTRPDPNRTFARIITKMCYIRQLSAGFYDWLESKPLDLFVSVKQKSALMAEWLS